MSKPTATPTYSSWTHVRANSGQGLEEQHIFRIGPAPAISLKPNGERQWTASILYPSGISTAGMVMTNKDLSEAKAECITTARDMGWEVPDAAA